MNIKYFFIVPFLLLYTLVVISQSDALAQKNTLKRIEKKILSIDDNMIGLFLMLNSTFLNNTYVWLFDLFKAEVRLLTLMYNNQKGLEFSPNLNTPMQAILTDSDVQMRVETLSCPNHSVDTTELPYFERANNGIKEHIYLLNEGDAIASNRLHVSHHEVFILQDKKINMYCRTCDLFIDYVLDVAYPPKSLSIKYKCLRYKEEQIQEMKKFLATYISNT